MWTKSRLGFLTRIQNLCTEFVKGLTLIWTRAVNVKLSLNIVNISHLIFKWAQKLKLPLDRQNILKSNKSVKWRWFLGQYMKTIPLKLNKEFDCKSSLDLLKASDRDDCDADLHLRRSSVTLQRRIFFLIEIRFEDDLQSNFNNRFQINYVWQSIYRSTFHIV